MENFDNIEQEFKLKVEKEAMKIGGRRPNVLICGYTGSGKSSLIKAVCGDLVPDEAIGNCEPRTTGYDEYRSDHIRIWDSKGLELGETEEEFTERTRRFVRERQEDPDVDNHIHIVWYTIQGPGARVTDCDLNLIRHIFTPDNVIVVVTKCDVTRPAQLEALTQKLAETGVDSAHIVAVSDAESGARGCKELMALTYRMLPEAYRDSFMEAQRVDREAKIEAVHGKRSRASAIITAATTAAAGIGAIPIPIADAGLLISTQTSMIAALAALYGLRKEAIKHAALPFVAKVVGVYSVSSILKLIPGLGSAVNAVVAASITGALGWYVRDCFEGIAVAKINGGPVPELRFDADMFRSYYKDYKKSA